MRRRISAVLAALALTPAACTAAEPDALDACVLTIATGVDVSGGVRQRLLDRWNAEHAEARACFREISAVADEQHSEMIGAAQAESTAYDVFVLDIQWIPEFAEGGYLLELDVDRHGRTDEAEIPRQVWQAGSWHGVHYAAPFNSDVPLLFHRLDTPPATWDELITRIRDDARDRDRTAFATQLAAYEGLVVNAMEAVWAAGGEWVNADGEVTIDTEAGHKGLDNLIAAVRPPAPAIPRRVLEHYEDDSLTEYSEHGALAMRNWAYAHEVLSGEKDVEFTVSPLPWPGVLGGQYLAVAATSAHPDLAQELVAELTGTEAAARLYRCGGFVPARMSAFDTEVTCENRPEAQTSSDSVSRAAPPVILKEALAAARPRPATPYYPQFGEVLQSELHRLLRCHASGARTCESAAAFARRITPMLERALEGRVG